MAGILRDDDIDFAAHMRDTDCKAKVRSATAYEADLLQEFIERPKGERPPTMFSSRLRHMFEFRPGEVTVWAGYNGHRKSMFVGQVMAELCVQRQRCLVASFEMSPGRTLARMAKQTFGMQDPGPSSLRHFAKWTDNRLWLFDHMGRISTDQMLAVCQYFADKLQGQHVLIDSMQFVCASEENLDEQKQFMTDIVRFGQETGVHMHVVAHCRKPLNETQVPTKYDIRGSAAISDQAHNVITVWADKAKKDKLLSDPHNEALLAKPDAAVTIEKQRNSHFEGRLKYWFDELSFRFTDERTTPIEPWVLD